jgi:hypothetical protein
MRNVSDESCREDQNMLLILNHFLQKSYHLWDDVKICGIPRQATDDYAYYGAEKLWFACQITRVRMQTHTHNIEYYYW